MIKTSFAVAGGVIALANTVLYAVLITREGLASNMPGAALWVAAMTLLSLAAIRGAREPEVARRRRLLVCSSLGLIVIGVLGMFTIGLPLLLAGVLVACAIPGRTPRPGELPF